MKKLGVPGILARTMPAEELIHIVRRPGSNGDDRCFMLSRLLAADAHVYNSEGKNDTSHNLYATSLGILKELEKDAEGEKLEQYQKEIDEIRFQITENARDDVHLDM
jgi:argininosuccinate lyase